MRVAEQVSVEQPPDVVVALLGQRPCTWLQPFLSLAWNEGEAALRRLGHVSVAASALAAGGAQLPPTGAADHLRSDHQLRLSDPAPRPGGTAVFGIVWTVDEPKILFRRLRGDLAVEPFGDAAVLGLRATCVPEGDTGSLGTAQRPVELVVRSLLGHIRTALE